MLKKSLRIKRNSKSLRKKRSKTERTAQQNTGCKRTRITQRSRGNIGTSQERSERQRAEND